MSNNTEGPGDAHKSEFREAQVNIRDLSFVDGLTPKIEEFQINMMADAVSGKLPCYIARVPLALCVPCDLDYRPDLHPVGRQAIEQFLRMEAHPLMLVYPRGRWLIVFDDYIPLFAAVLGRKEFVTCCILGEAEVDLLKEIRGPLAPKEVRSLMGIPETQSLSEN